MIGALQTDRSLVRHSLQGSRDAFARLVERHHGSVYAVALAISRNHADAEDAVQDAFVKAFESLPTLREPQRFGNWVAHICRNLCRDRWRMAQRREAALADAAQVEPDARDDAARDEVHALVRDQLERLDETSREVLVLYYYAGRNTREIAELLDIETPAAKKRLERARAALSKQLLGELQAAPSKEKESEQLKRILLALAATTPLWMTTGATVGAAVGVATVTKIAAGLAVAAALVSVGAAVLVQSQGSPAGAVGTAAAPEAADAAATIDQAAPSTVSPTEEIVLAENETPEAPSDAAPAGEARPLSLNLALLEGAVKERVNAPVSLNMEDVHIGRILGFAGTYLKFGVVVMPSTSDIEPEPYVTDGIVASIDVKDVPLQTALEEVLWPLGLDVAIEPGYFWVSTPERIKQDIEPARRADLAKYGDDEKLAMPVTLQSTDEHVATILDGISEAAKTCILIDFRVVQPAAKATPFPNANKVGRSEKPGRIEELAAGDEINIGLDSEGKPLRVRVLGVDILDDVSSAMIAINHETPRPMAARSGNPWFHVEAVDADSKMVRLFVYEWPSRQAPVPQQGAVATRRSEPDFAQARSEAGPEEPSTEEPAAPVPGIVSYVNLRNITLGDAFPGLFRMVDYEYRFMPGYVLAVPKGELAALAVDHDHGGEVFAPEIAGWLEAPLALELERKGEHQLGGQPVTTVAALAKVVEESGKEALGADFTVRIASPGLPEHALPDMSFPETPLAIVLDAVLTPVGVEWSINGHELTLAPAPGERTWPLDWNQR